LTTFTFAFGRPSSYNKEIFDREVKNLNANLKLYNDLLVFFSSFLLGHLQEMCLIFSGFFGAALVLIVFFPQSSKRRRLKSMKTPSFLTGLTI
jgi:hypothetical protein